MEELIVEIANTPYLQEQGLMFRKHLDENAGMLFIFKRPQELNFWGLNTYIPLDIAFIDEDNKIVKIDKIKTLSQKTVSSDEDCIMALEVNEDFFVKNGIKEGFLVKIDKRDDENVITFEKP